MDCTLLIIGAGPYGLAMAAMARHLGLATIVTGKPLEFWERHTPPGMPLRSGWDWHIDPLEEHTFQRYLHEHDGPPSPRGSRRGSFPVSSSSDPTWCGAGNE